MAGELIKEVKKAAAEEYIISGDIERSSRVAFSGEYSPITEKASFHPEEESSVKKINSVFKDVLNDLYVLDYETMFTALNYKKLAEETMRRVNDIKSDIEMSKEKLEDLNMLCSPGSGFFNVIDLEESDFEDSNYENKILTSSFSESIDTNLEVADVVGNGSEGNKYVLKDGKFLDTSVDTANRNHITDKSSATYYEYQRIRADKRGAISFNQVNIDNVDVYCTMTIQADRAITSLSIDTDDEGLTIAEVFVSEDGEKYVTVSESNVKIKDKEMRYEDNSYIYGAGIISLPPSKFVKISLTTKSITGDEIAFEYVPSLSNASKKE